ncbi:MAG TPA: hypothetical protein VFG14_08295, partial [Chthoniobacteraceae bacterium]|nr:hypothetical protein [Chthoniobacteraceae bacterium]
MNAKAPSGPVSNRFFDFVSKLRFLSVSFLLHSILVLLCGTVVLFKAVQPVEDFVSQGGPLVN